MDYSLIPDRRFAFFHYSPSNLFDNFAIAKALTILLYRASDANHTFSATRDMEIQKTVFKITDMLDKMNNPLQIETHNPLFQRGLQTKYLYGLKPELAPFLSLLDQHGLEIDEKKIFFTFPPEKLYQALYSTICPFNLEIPWQGLLFVLQQTNSKNDYQHTGFSVTIENNNLTLFTPMFGTYYFQEPFPFSSLFATMNTFAYMLSSACDVEFNAITCIKLRKQDN